MIFDWHVPTRVMFGPGVLSRLSDVLDEIGAWNVLVACGGSSMRSAGVLERLECELSGFEVCFHQGVGVNLPLDECDVLIKAVREVEPDAVIGLGGGSVMDGAKAAAWLGPHSGWIRDFLDADVLPGGGLPFVSVPTTAGTGSEVTPFIILLDRDKKQKLSLGAPCVFPEAAVVDPELTLTLPPDQTAATGLDALSHGLEAFWSKNANPVSDALALESISVIVDQLDNAYKNPGDIEARTWMSYAAMTAGMALSQTATAAVHGITYPMTAHYGVPHGVACAFMMREVMKINFHHLDPEKQKRLLYAMKSNTISAALDLLTELYVSLNVPQTLTELDIPHEEVERFAGEATQKNLDKNIASIGYDKLVELWSMKKGD